MNWDIKLIKQLPACCPVSNRFHQKKKKEKHNAGLSLVLLVPEFLLVLPTGVCLFCDCCDSDICLASSTQGWPISHGVQGLSFLLSSHRVVPSSERALSVMGCASGRLLRATLNRQNSWHCDGKAHRHLKRCYCPCMFVCVFSRLSIVHLGPYIVP